MKKLLNMNRSPRSTAPWHTGYVPLTILCARNAFNLLAHTKPLFINGL